jgi:hypothetical protein
MFRRLRSLLHCLCQNLHRLSRKWWNVNGRCKQFFAHPYLACRRQTITSGKRQAQPSRSLRFVADLLKSFTSPHRHRVILRPYQINRRALCNRQFQPGLHRSPGSFLGPPRLQRSHLNVRRFRFHHPGSPHSRRRTVRGSFNVQNRPTPRQQHGELPSLYPANLSVIGTHGKDGPSRRPPQLRQIIRSAVQHRPTDSRSTGRPSHLRQRRPPHRFHHNRIRPRPRRALDRLQKFRALMHRIVTGIDNLQLALQFARRIFRRSRLCHLEIVLAGMKRYKESNLSVHCAKMPLDRLTILTIINDTPCPKRFGLRLHHLIPQAVTWKTIASPPRRRPSVERAFRPASKAPTETGLSTERSGRARLQSCRQDPVARPGFSP